MTAQSDLEKRVAELEKKVRALEKKPKPFDMSEFENEDELLPKAREIVIAGKNASASYIQRKLDIGYARSARILDELQKSGVVGPASGIKPRKILVDA
jgi:S-DNA-T family DNA segregation ATPase FtsK/SpoIIIE